MKSLKKLLLLLVIVGLVAAAFTYFRDTAAPVARLTPGFGPISNKTALALDLSDEGTGLKTLLVEAVQGDVRQILLQQEFPPQTCKRNSTCCSPTKGSKRAR